MEVNKTSSTHKPIQVVDTRGKFVGVAQSPFEAIEAGQIRLLARVVVTDESGRFLLQKRAKDIKMYPGCWDTSASGHVDEGETAEQAAHRELKEEIGLTTPLQLVTRYYDNLFIARYSLHFKSYNLVYRGTFSGDITQLRLATDEVVAVQWFSRQQIKALITRRPEQCTDGLLKIFGDGLV